MNNNLEYSMSNNFIKLQFSYTALIVSLIFACFLATKAFASYLADDEYEVAEYATTLEQGAQY